MQPAVSIPWSGAFVATALTLAAALAPPAWRVPMPMVQVERATSFAIDDTWHHANHLAWVIEHRRYEEIAAMAAMIDDASPYAPWVPVAIGLAVEQLDATAAAYAQMGRCSELGAFVRRVERAWPAGRAAMRRVSCGTFSCGTFSCGTFSCGTFSCGTDRREMIRALGGSDVDRRMIAAQWYEELAFEVRAATAAGDHARALASCRAIGDGPLPATCLAAACRAGELSIAEVLLPHGDIGARAACVDAGVTFASGIARAPGVWHPADLVHVHPDAPAPAGVITDW